jgi:AcrR family transcriptional regulator
MTEQAPPDEPDGEASAQQAPRGAPSARATGPAVRSSGRGQRRREQILAAAIRHVARNGGRGTSLAQIATEAGVTQQGLLYYFPSKDELLHAALDVRDQRDVVPRRTPWQGLEFLDGIVERIRRWRQEPEMVGMFTLLLVENLGDHAPLRDRLENRYTLVHKEYADGVRAAQANGTARADIDPDLKAIEVIAFLNGLETSWLLNPSLPVEDVAAAWRDSQVAQMTAGLGDHGPGRAAPLE